MGVHMLQTEGAGLKTFRNLQPHWFEWAERRISRTEMYSTHTSPHSNWLMIGSAIFAQLTDI